MNWMQQFFQQATPFLLANGILIGLTSPTLQVSATPSFYTSGNGAIALETLKIPNNGAPGDRGSNNSGSRPSCPENARFISLSPLTNWGETLENKPTFLLYFSAEPAAIQFTLKDETTLEEIYQTLVVAEPKPGLFKFRIPDHAPDLEVDRLYRWIFQVSCLSSASPEKEGLQVNGVLVRRSNSELQTKIETASPEEKVDLYAENGFWFDTLNELLKLRCAEPDNPEFATDWASLLEHPLVQLNELVEEPIARACID